MAASNIDHAYEDSQVPHADSDNTNGITDQYSAVQSSDSNLVTGLAHSANHNHQSNPANYGDSEWSFSTTTETQAELPEPPRRSMLGDRLTVSSNAASLSDSAEPSMISNDTKIDASDLPSALLGTSRPSLSTIAQLPNSSYISAISGSSQSSQLQIPTLEQLDLPETQSYPLRLPPQNATTVESQQSVSENTDSQVSRDMERTRRHSLISGASSHHILTTSKRSPQAYQSTVSSSNGSNDKSTVHQAKKSRPQDDIGHDLPKITSTVEQYPSSSTIPPTSVIESLPLEDNPSQQRELSPGYGTQDMNVQISSAPSIRMPSSPEKSLAPNLIKARSVTVGPSQGSAIVRAVSQGRGLPVRRPWHGRASSSSTSASFQMSSVSHIAPSPEKGISHPPPLADEAKVDTETTDVLALTGDLNSESIKTTLDEDNATFPATFSPETLPDGALGAPNARLCESPRTLPETTTSLASKFVTSPNIPYATKRLFVRDGSLYYLATVRSARSAGGDLVRVDFDDGSFSEVTRSSLQRSSVAAKLIPGDIVVDSTESKRTKQQRFAFVRHENSSSSKNNADIQKDDTIVVKLEKVPQSPKQQGGDEELQSMPAKSVALIAGPHVQDKSRAIDVDLLLPSTNTNEGVQHRSRTASDAVTSSLFNSVGLLFTSVDQNICGHTPGDLATMNGAQVVDSFDDIIEVCYRSAGKGKGKAVDEPASLKDLNSILLVSRGHVTTPKYLQALALGVPCVSSIWLEDCVRQKEILCWKPYALGAGCPSRTASPILGIQANVIIRPAFGLKDLVTHQVQLSIFSDIHLVYLHAEDVAATKRSELASSLFKLLGGKQVTLKPMNKSMKLPSIKPGCLLLMDGPIANLSKSAAKSVEAHGFQSWQWLKDCIVSGRIVPPN